MQPNPRPSGRGFVVSREDAAPVIGPPRFESWPDSAGALVKRASLRHLREQRPDVWFVNTTNDARNAPMLRINSALGFRPVARYTQMSLRLGPREPGPD